ncbi:MAG: DUF4012 domain-containing protein, partial [Gemmatimonadota bacterium]
LDTAFGANGEARYLILLQNREEPRPSGGFPGTFAVVTVSNGQLSGYEIDNIYTLDQAYLARRNQLVPAPGPIRAVLGQQELLPHDAMWSPDFSEAARVFLSLYAETGWPPLTGVIGLTDSVIQQVLAVVGPYRIEVDGQHLTVTAESFMQLIEAYRDLTWQDMAAHKRVVAILGDALIQQVKAADFATKKRIYFALREAADRRELQLYLSDPGMQAEVARRGWDGAIQPVAGIPTMAMTVAGLTGGKKGLTIHASSTIEVTPSHGGTRIRWTVTLDHRGDPAGNEVYNGYEYAWLSLYLPEGARVIATSRPRAPEGVADDLRAVSFGIGILPGTTQPVTITFDLPAPAERLLIRRQAGFNDVAVRVRGTTGHCPMDWSFALSHDYLVRLTDCIALPAQPDGKGVIRNEDAILMVGALTH